MKQGDFTLLAKDYIHRTGYSINVLKSIVNHVTQKSTPPLITADVGAGTGKLTQDLIDIGLSGIAIEPNKSMRTEGVKNLSNTPFSWIDGTAEMTTLPDSSVDLILMGSSFHWTDQLVALKEFHRILKPKGFFTAIWNPRDIEQSPLHQEIEKIIYDKIPSLKRRSSGSEHHTKNLDQKLMEKGYFKDLFFIESSYEVEMSQERYMGAWRSVNDIQAQAGPLLFEEILKAIQERISHLTSIFVPYKTRAWTVQSTKDD